jgi:hypothetical protein
MTCAPIEGGGVGGGGGLEEVPLDVTPDEEVVPDEEVIPAPLVAAADEGGVVALLSPEDEDVGDDVALVLLDGR